MRDSLLNKLDGRFDKLDQKLEKIGDRLNKLEVGQAQLTVKVDNIDKTTNELKDTQKKLVSDVADLKGAKSLINNKRSPFCKKEKRSHNNRKLLTDWKPKKATREAESNRQ